MVWILTPTQCASQQVEIEMVFQGPGITLGFARSETCIDMSHSLPGFVFHPQVLRSGKTCREMCPCPFLQITSLLFCIPEPETKRQN